MNKISRFSGEYEFLSNFGFSLFEYEGRMFVTVEHAYQAYKSLDPAIFDAIANAPTAALAKKAGRSLVNLRKDWESIKLKLMRDLVYAKFKQNPDLAAKLLSTGNAVLEEGNTWNDTYWGVCRGQGKNMLGKTLMEVRERLRNENHK